MNRRTHLARGGALVCAAAGWRLLAARARRYRDLAGSESGTPRSLRSRPARSSGIDRMAADELLNQKLRALADEAFAAYVPAPLNKASASFPRRWQVATGLAASVAVAVIAWQISPQVMREQVQTIAYETAAHERRTVALDDGSKVELDVDTQIAVRLGTERRQIELLSGRALFEVAHDASRPFSVTAAGSRTTALGTKFQVQRDGAWVVVTLTRGLCGCRSRCSRLVGRSLARATASR